MFIEVNPKRALAFVTLLAQPDPNDLAHRGHHIVQVGAEDRWRRWMPRLLRGQRDAIIETRPWVEIDDVEL